MPKTLIAVPCVGKVDVDFMTSILMLDRLPNTHYSFHVGSLVYDSRNTFAVNAITQEYDRVLFLDSDMIFQPDTLKILSADMDTGLDLVAGLYFARKAPTRPMIYKRLEVERDGKVEKSFTENYADYPRDSLFEVAAAGTGCMLISANLIRKVWDTYGPAFMPMPSLGEDLAFCYRASQLGVKMYCDSRVKAGHIGTVIFDEDAFLAQQKAEEQHKKAEA